MGSVIDYKKCPQCGGIMYNDYNYRNQEEYSSCERCGKGFTYLMKRDENGQVVLNDKKQPEYVLKEWDGKGVAHLMGEKCGESCHFSEPVTEEFIKQFLEEVETNTSLKKEECYLTTWDEETKTVKAIYGKIPKLFDEV